MHATTSMNTKNIMLSERSQSQKATYYMVPFIGNVLNTHVHIKQKYSNASDSGKWSKCRVTANEYEISFWGDENISQSDNRDICIIL